jgi:hypothetical protein
VWFIRHGIVLVDRVVETFFGACLQEPCDFSCSICTGGLLNPRIYSKKQKG